MTRLARIFGYPLEHSISPRFQQAAFDHCSLDVTYQAWPVAPGDLEREVVRLREDDYLGANVTVPHKERVAAYMDALDPLAERIGAVNTIVKDGRKLVGHNTDAHGFIEALRKEGGFEPRGRRVLVLGAGGAARAAVFALADAGATSLVIANRTLARAESLARELAREIGAADPEVNALPMEKPALSLACEHADLIVNTTSIGMLHGPAEGETPLSADVIRPRTVVYDLVYNPPETPLLAQASAAGARTLGGLHMLVYQGAAAFELWTGVPAPVDVMVDAARRAL